MNIYPGQIVYSIAGRDKKKCFIVVKKTNEDYVYISDGDIRKLDKPKKKKLKHLRFTGQHAQHVKDKFEKLQKVSNADLRRAIKAFVEEIEI